MTTLNDLLKQRAKLRRLIDKAAKKRDYVGVEIYGEALASVEEQIARCREAN